MIEPIKSENNAKTQHSPLNVALTGGGTAGHIYPALALAEELEKRNCNVFFAGTPGGIESRLVPQAGIAFVPFEASGFNRRHPTTLIKGVLTIKKSESLAKKWLQEANIDVVVGFGGYASLPVARAALALNIPVVIHEQNSFMGMANKQLSRHATKTCLTYEVAARGTHAKNICVTGNPVRASVLSVTKEAGREKFDIPSSAVVLLVFGGSLGARHINQAITQMKDCFLARENVHVIHVAGPKEFDSTRESLALTIEDEKRYHLYDYLDSMPYALACADAVVSRAGATSLAEISARCIPALLVPYPYATGNHQTMNAQACVDAGAAFSISDDKVESAEFRDYVLKLIDSEQLRERMSDAARSLKTSDAAQNLACEVIGAAHKCGE